MSGFVDEAQLHAKAGDGGAGSVSFRREAHVDRGGPDGGDGGRGGDVWLVASHNQSSLLAFRDHPHRRGTDGGHGAGKKKHGSRGDSIEVPVPIGTVVRDRDGALLCDLAGHHDRFLAAEGGRGGMGNARFLSNRRRAPAFAEQGEHGEEKWLNLELKLMADVALVGFPNVGKSTLISAVSAARPKIADYPFTTLEPHLGVVRVGGRSGRPGGPDEVELVMADIPGLVEGAAEGRGLGHRFLRHIERARALIVLLDLAPADGVTPADQLTILLGELERYQPSLLERPRLVVGSKGDLVGEGDRSADSALVGEDGAGTDDLGAADDNLDAADDAGQGCMDLVISAVTGENVPELLYRVAAMVTEAREAETVAELGEIVIHRPIPEGVNVERLGLGQWAVLGRAAERAVGFSDLSDSGALDEAIRRLGRLGVDRALSRAGAHDGDEVHVGEISFTWYRDRSAGVLDVPVPNERPARTRRRSGDKS